MYSAYICVNCIVFSIYYIFGLYMYIQQILPSSGQGRSIAEEEAEEEGLLLLWGGAGRAAARWGGPSSASGSSYPS